MRYILILFISLIAGDAYSQYYYPYSYSYYPRYYTPQIRYIPYYVPYSIPRRKATESEIQEKWRKEDAWKERYKPENYLDRKERYLTQAKRAYELNLREEEYKRQGIIKTNPDAGVYIHEGVKYPSYDVFKESPAYAVMMNQKRIDRENKEFLKLYEKNRDNAFLRMWHGMSDLERERYNRLSSEEKEIRIDKFDSNW